MEGFNHTVASHPEAEGKGAWGYVHSVHSMGALDGPGLRYLVFLAGCAFRCLYCHNPDSWQAHANQKKNIEEVLAGIGKYAPFLREAGGLTISGGEPLGQPAFVQRLAIEAKARWGLHVALDTQGHLHARLDDAWWDAIDLVLLDIKHSNEEDHKKLTGFPLGPSVACGLRLAALGKKIWIRHVVVPGITDGKEHFEALGNLLSGISTIERVELLPFHQLGSHKWKELGLRYTLGDVAPPSEESMARGRSILSGFGLDVR